ncbi:hypothetical protein R9X49_04260 [Pectobacterium carotovorum]|uniref:hypothetical protein n=1 Tax=Pectobacterium carotovorum TaxID=554 RepID=UPI0029D515AF|nr:hypothetical protein [Pectobacterium carotovorum]MDX6914311.1 hypothetical protein [Pectobacterium carotovorum]
MTYYCWLVYYDKNLSKQIKSDEVKYYTGHQHGVQPTDKDWRECRKTLLINVNAERRKKKLPELPSIPDSETEKKTRSEH